jgi:hypothetical protein
MRRISFGTKNFGLVVGDDGNFSVENVELVLTETPGKHPDSIT